jgi:hypothetical protein
MNAHPYAERRAHRLMLLVIALILIAGAITIIKEYGRYESQVQHGLLGAIPPNDEP